MSAICALIGAFILATAANGMDKHIQPSNIVGVSVGGFLLLFGLLTWYFGGDE